MEGLQRSAVSFRRQGSSGLIWDDKFLSELTQAAQNEESGDKAQPEQEQAKDEVKPIKTPESIERSRSNGGGRGYRTGKVSPAIEPPSPKVSACGFCSALGKPNKSRRRPKFSGKRKT